METIVISLRDAVRGANFLIDRFRGQFTQEYTNVFVFESGDIAYDACYELTMHGIEVENEEDFNFED